MLLAKNIMESATRTGRVMKPEAAVLYLGRTKEEFRRMLESWTYAWLRLLTEVVVFDKGYIIYKKWTIAFL